MLRIKSDSMGCLIATTIIIALIVIGFIFFREKLLATSAVIVILAAPFLPLYYVYRKNQEERRITVEYEVYKVVSESIENLKEVEELVEGSIEELKGFGWHIKHFEKGEIEEIEAKLKSYKNVLQQESWEDAKLLLELYRDELINGLEESKELGELGGEVGLASEYGSEIRYLYTVLKKIRSITYSLRGI